MKLGVSSLLAVGLWVIPAAAGAQYVAETSAAPPAKAASCTPCHGEEGRSSTPLIPILAGQSARYLYLQLRDFQAGRRSDPQMSPMAAGLSRDEMHALTDWFSTRRPPPQTFVVDPEKARLGKQKADETLCTMCHLGGFAGQNEIPRVAGQNPAYVMKQLQDFKAQRRTNDAGNMTAVSRTLSDADIENLAHYIAAL
ncbi:MAG: c-type cytochrome [Rhodocyclaceae bacterium]|nr:c-type cytochrome [Rhodocyclaceae bacterium]